MCWWWKNTYEYNIGWNASLDLKFFFNLAPARNEIFFFACMFANDSAEFMVSVQEIMYFL